MNDKVFIDTNIIIYAHTDIILESKKWHKRLFPKILRSLVHK